MTSSRCDATTSRSLRPGGMCLSNRVCSKELPENKRQKAAELGRKNTLFVRPLIQCFFSKSGSNLALDGSASRMVVRSVFKPLWALNVEAS